MKFDDIKIGMKVRVLSPVSMERYEDSIGWNDEMQYMVGKVYEVSKKDARDSTIQVGYFWFFASELELVESTQLDIHYPNPPQKHKDTIIAWANGAQIQVKDSAGFWNDITGKPGWYESMEYRVKPQEEKKAPPKAEWIEVNGVRPEGFHPDTRVIWIGEHFSNRDRPVRISGLNFTGDGENKVLFIKVVE